MSRDLAVETVNGPDGQPRLLLRLPTWEDYVALALDEIIAVGSSSWQVRPRVERLLTELVAIAPAERAEALQVRLERVRPQAQGGGTPRVTLVSAWLPESTAGGLLWRTR